MSEGPKSGVTDKLPEIVMRSGVSAQVQRNAEGGDVLRIHDPQGRLLVEVRDDTRTVVIAAGEGDLELRADKGKVRIVGADGVEIDGPTISMRAEKMRQVVGVLEIHAKRILEKAVDVYRDVEGLSQMRASDVRIVARKTLRTLAERLRMRAKKDVKVDGEKIYLG